MNFKRIFWPWGVIAELEDDVFVLEDKIEELESELEDTEILTSALETILDSAIRDFATAAAALIDIVEATSTIKVPNGTMKKIQRIAETGLANLVAQVTPELREMVATLLEAEAAEAEAQTAVEEHAPKAGDAQPEGVAV